MMLIALIVAWFGLVGASFTPGCSFANGQCAYTVQLGHQGQCDSLSQPTTTDNAACCTGLRTDLTDLHALVSGLSKDLQHLQHNYTTMKNHTTDLSTSYTDLQKQMEMKEAELNETHHAMAAVLHHANDEITRLRGIVAVQTRELNNCKGTLGLQTSTTITPAFSGTVNLTFCDFQSIDRFCGFDKTSPSSYHWKSHSGGLNHLTGPVEDHTYGSPHGQYMFMNAYENPGSHNVLHTYTMESHEFQPSPAACIRFWYNMRGSDIRMLSVYAKIGGGNGYPIWTLSGNQGSIWHMAEVNLDSEYTSSPFTIVVEGTTDSYKTSWPTKSSYNMNADIAFDDLYVYNTSCMHIPLCLPGAVKHNINNVTSCYTFHFNPSTWYQAAETCRMEGPQSALVSVTSQAEQQFLVHHIKSDSALMLSGNYGYYTSGNDERLEGHFDWTDTGTPYQGVYTDWHSGQPNNIADNQNCLLLQYSETDFEWGDIPCSTKHPFICEARFPLT